MNDPRLSRSKRLGAESSLQKEIFDFIGQKAARLAYGKLALNARRTTETQVGIQVSRAVLCPNDDVIYDGERWILCPTCDNEERVELSKILNREPEPAARALPICRRGDHGVSMPLLDSYLKRRKAATALL